MNKYESVIPWHLLKEQLKLQLARVDGQLRRATNEQLAQLQGRAQLLEELMHIPELLAIIEQEEENARKNQKS